MTSTLRTALLVPSPCGGDGPDDDASGTDQIQSCQHRTGCPERRNCTMTNAFISNTSHLAESASDREQVYRLRYRQKGFIAESAEEAFSDDFDSKPNSFSFLVHSDTWKPLATVRINVVRPAQGWNSSRPA